MTDPTKRCGTCGNTKPDHDFSKDRSRRDGLMNRCRACDNGHDPESPQACKRCGAAFYGRKRKYCRRDCYVKTGRPAAAVHVCEICEAPFKIAGGRNVAQRTCSRKCGGERRRRAGLLGQRREVAWASCVRCHSVHVTVRRKRCPSCYGSRRRPLLIKTCANCARPVAGTKALRYCEPCGRGVERRRAKQRRRLRLAALGGQQEPYTLHQIAERDGWDCHLCAEPTDQLADRAKHDWAPTIDHVVPIANGGDDTAENVRIAHRWCNSVRWTMPVETARILLAA